MGVHGTVARDWRAIIGSFLMLLVLILVVSTTPLRASPAFHLRLRRNCGIWNLLQKVYWEVLIIHFQIFGRGCRL